MMNKVWTLEQEQTLISNYSTLGKFGCMSLLNKSESSIRNKAARLGLRSQVTKALSDEDYKKKLADTNIVNIEPYSLNNIKILHKHLVCGYIWKATPNNILNGTKCPRCSRKKYSKLAIQWIESLDLNAIHAENGGEYIIHGFKVDGYNPELDIVYEFHGDVFHGNLDIFESTSRPHPFNNKSTETLWEETYKRMEIISREVKSLVFIWENDYLNGRQEQKFPS